MRWPVSEDSDCSVNISKTKFTPQLTKIKGKADFSYFADAGPEKQKYEGYNPTKI